jgi:hypothetical protein
VKIEDSISLYILKGTRVPLYASTWRDDIEKRKTTKNDLVVLSRMEIYKGCLYLYDILRISHRMLRRCFVFTMG